MKENEITGKEKFLNGLSSFLSKNKIILIIILAAIIALIIGISIFDSISSNKANKAAIRVENVQDSYDEWVALPADDENKETKKTELLDSLDNIINDNETAFAEQRALYIKGNVLFNTDEWKKASESFKAASEAKENSYLSPISLMLSASALENNSDYKGALDIYLEIKADYEDSFPEIPRVCLSIGRLYEQTEDKDSAIKSYNDLIDKYPETAWASFAHTRLIQIDQK